MQQVTYDFGFGEQHSHWLFRADQVGLADDTPGLYGWFMRSPSDVLDERGSNAYRQVYAERHFEVSAKAALGEHMQGHVTRRRTDLRTARIGEELDQSLFASAFAAFAPPIYIGRSMTLKKRLQSHLRSLTNELGRASIDAKADDGTTEAPDSDEESAKFGVRVGRILRAEGIDHFRGLFVKVVYATENVATKRAEYILNRTFHPALGRL